MGAGRSAAGNGDAPKRHETDEEPVSLYVFKNVSDAFAGRISYFKVFSGVLKNDATLLNFSRGAAGEVRAHLDHAGKDGDSGATSCTRAILERSRN